MAPHTLRRHNRQFVQSEGAQHAQARHGCTFSANTHATGMNTTPPPGGLRSEAIANGPGKGIVVYAVVTGDIKAHVSVEVLADIRPGTDAYHDTGVIVGFF